MFFSLFLKGVILPLGMGNSGCYGKGTQQQEQRYPFIPVCTRMVSVQAVVWLPVLGTFKVHTDIDAFDCEKNSLPQVD